MNTLGICVFLLFSVDSVFISFLYCGFILYILRSKYHGKNRMYMCVLPSQKLRRFAQLRVPNIVYFMLSQIKQCPCLLQFTNNL